MTERPEAGFFSGSGDHLRRGVETGHSHAPLGEGDRVGPGAAVELQHLRAGRKGGKKRRLAPLPEVTREPLLFELFVIPCCGPIEESRRPCDGSAGHERHPFVSSMTALASLAFANEVASAAKLFPP